MSDEGFREIQLNGKQLIFLFMAVTVVLVVTFLFGVLTGRGVREGAATTEIASAEVVPDPGLAPAADNAAAPPSPAPSSTCRRVRRCRAPGAGAAGARDRRAGASPPRCGVRCAPAPPPAPPRYPCRSRADTTRTRA